MDEIRKAILRQILKLDKQIGIDKRLITNDVIFLEKVLKKRKTGRVVKTIGLAITMALAITLPLFHYYGCLQLREMFSGMSSFFILFTMFWYIAIVNNEKRISNLETKIFLLKLAQSLNELKQ